MNSAGRPGECPVLARAEKGTWHQHDKPTSEFLHRVLADVAFQPFKVARYAVPPTFEPGFGKDE